MSLHSSPQPEPLDHVVADLFPARGVLKNCWLVPKSWVLRDRKHFFTSSVFRTAQIMEGRVSRCRRGWLDPCPVSRCALPSGHSRTGINERGISLRSARFLPPFSLQVFPTSSIGSLFLKSHVSSRTVERTSATVSMSSGLSFSPPVHPLSLKNSLVGMPATSYIVHGGLTPGNHCQRGSQRG